MRNIATVNDVLTADQCVPRTGTRWYSKAIAATARHERLLFALLILAHLIPIWAFTYLPTTDGAAHLANADVMRKINDPAHSVFSQYYYVSHAPTPNLIGHLLLAGLLYIVKPLVAEKMLVSLYIVLFPLAVRYALRGIRKQATPLAFLAFPMIYSYVFAQGFYNFCLSIPAFFFLVGYWVRTRDRLNFGRGLALAGLAMLLYGSHLFSLMMACGVLGLMTLWFSARELRTKATGEERKLIVRRAIIGAAITFLALLPWVVLSLRYRPAAGQYPPVDWSLKEDVVALLRFSTMVSYRANEAWLGGALASLFGALTLFVLVGKFTRRRLSKWDALLLIPAGLAAVYLKAHDPASVHFYIPPRVMLYCFLTLLLWLAGQPMTRRLRWAVPPLAAIIALGFVVSHALKYREFAPQLREFVSAGDQIKPNSTFLPLIFAPQGRDANARPSSIDVAPFYMASGYIAVARDSVDLRNYEANTDHFPVRFLPERNPYEKLAVGKGFETIPPTIDLAKFAGAGGQVDYVLLWGMTDEQRKDPGTVALLAQLAQDYDEVELPNARWTELWRRRGIQ
jgi:hypothetical protein